MSSTRVTGTAEAARKERLRVSGKPSGYDDLDVFRREQDLPRQLASESMLSMLELDTSDGDQDASCDAIADWMASTAGCGRPGTSRQAEPGSSARPDGPAAPAHRPGAL